MLQIHELNTIKICEIVNIRQIDAFELKDFSWNGKKLDLNKVQFIETRKKSTKMLLLQSFVLLCQQNE